MKNKFEYGVNEVPPFHHLLISSVQHVLLMFVAIGLPILFANQVNASARFTASLVSFSMIAAGLGSILQSAGIPHIGSGYLCPNVCGPSYLSLSLSAAWVGGLPLMRGMIIFAGLVEMAIAPIVQRLRRIFPNFIIGLVMALVGVSIIKMSVAAIFGLNFRGDIIRNVDLLIGMFSLLIMVMANIWGKGFLKMYCLLIGMLSGWILAVVLVPEYWHMLLSALNKPFFAVPEITTEFRGMSFDYKMLIPFFVIAVSGSLKSFGNLLAAQQISEPHLKERSFIPIRNGLMADGISTVLAGMLGGLAVDTSSSNVGLAGSTKVLSRWVSVAAGVIFTILAFLPKLTTALSFMPQPILGAALIFAGCFMICIGLQEMFRETWSERKTFVVGISLFFGLSTAFMPELYARTPKIIQTFFTDPLPTATIVAVILNQIFDLDTLFKK
ncbi:MAG: purine/pyrimidine permease [Candidatus Omnitrophica bacterium]|nr:purine/pyrimidine permease [Candidatus Omnitrophota bacterium]